MEAHGDRMPPLPRPRRLQSIVATELDDDVDALVRRSSASGARHSPRHFHTGSLLVRAAVEKIRVVVDDEPLTPQTPRSGTTSPKPLFLRQIPLSPKPGKPLTEADQDSDDEGRPLRSRASSRNAMAYPAMIHSRIHSPRASPLSDVKLDVRRLVSERFLVASLNLRACVSNGEYKVHAVGHMLAQLRCDVVGLQEIEVNSLLQQTRMCSARHADDQVKVLGKAASLPHTAFAPVLRAEYNPETKVTNKRAGGGEFGIAVLSRYPILEAKTKAFTGVPGKTPRNLLAVRIQPACLAHSKQSVWFVTTQLSKDVTGLRQKEQAKQLSAFLDQLHNESGGIPIIVCGDFGVAPWFASNKFLRQTKRSYGVLCDLWKSYGLGDIVADRSLGLAGGSDGVRITSCNFFRTDYCLTTEPLFSHMSCVGAGILEEGPLERKVLVAAFRPGPDTTIRGTPRPEHPGLRSLADASPVFEYDRARPGSPSALSTGGRLVNTLPVPAPGQLYAGVPRPASMNSFAAAQGHLPQHAQIPHSHSHSGMHALPTQLDMHGAAAAAAAATAGAALPGMAGTSMPVVMRARSHPGPGPSATAPLQQWIPQQQQQHQHQHHHQLQQHQLQQMQMQQLQQQMQQMQMQQQQQMRHSPSHAPLPGMPAAVPLAALPPGAMYYPMLPPGYPLPGSSGYSRHGRSSTGRPSSRASVSSSRSNSSASSRGSSRSPSPESRAIPVPLRPTARPDAAPIPNQPAAFLG